MKQTTYKCKQNDAVIRLFSNEDGIRELWVQIKGDDSWTIIGYSDLQKAISMAEKKAI